MTSASEPTSVNVPNRVNLFQEPTDYRQVTARLAPMLRRYLVGEVWNQLAKRLSKGKRDSEFKLESKTGELRNNTAVIEAMTEDWNRFLASYG